MRTMVIAVIVSGLLVGCGTNPKPALPTRDTPAQKAPESTVTSAPLTGQPAASGGEQEKPVALPKLWDFFATWCGPCREQAPIIAELEREYHGRIEIRSIDVDQERELAQRYSIEAVPTLVFLSAEGREVDRKVGLMSKEDIVARFRTLGFIQ